MEEKLLRGNVLLFSGSLNFFVFKAGSLKSLKGVPWGKSIHGIYLLFYFTINFWPVDLPPVFGCSSWPVLYKPKCLQKSGDM